MLVCRLSSAAGAAALDTALTRRHAPVRPRPRRAAAALAAALAAASAPVTPSLLQGGGVGVVLAGAGFPACPHRPDRSPPPSRLCHHRRSCRVGAGRGCPGRGRLPRLPPLTLSMCALVGGRGCPGRGRLPRLPRRPSPHSRGVGGAGLSWQRPAPPPAPPSAGAATATTTATCAPVLPLSSLARLQGWAPASGQPFEAVAVLGAGGAPPLTNDVPGLRWSAGHLAGLARAVRRRRVRDAGAVVVPPMRPVCAGLACGLPPGVGGRVGGSALGCDAHGPI